MRKKCIAIAKKAMVWALAASMLVATPLTASAAGLRDVYKVEDGWGAEVPSDSEDTRTGTVTTTNTGTSTVTGVLKDENKLTGIVLSETDVKMEMEGAYSPNAQVRRELTVDFEGSLSVEEKEDLMQHLTWKSGDLSVVALNSRVDAEGNVKVPNGVLDKMTLVAKAGGKTTVTVSLDDYKNNIHFSATANVSVKQYASGLDFSDELQYDAYEGVSLDLNDYLEKTPDTANDEVTFEIVDGQNLATLKNGVLKLKTKTAEKTVTVVAIGEHTKSKNYPITINKANPATKVEIYKGETSVGKSCDWLVNEDDVEQKFYAKLTAKYSDINEGISTDKVTWSSKKSDIVSVEGGRNVTADTEVTLVAKKVGKTTITAQASSGAKATLSVTVRANMTGFDIDVDNTYPLYSGQTLKLSTIQYYGKDKDSTEHPDFTETALKWDFVDLDGITAKEMKKVASVNSKGVLTIKPDLRNVTKIKLSATNAKKIGKTDDVGAAAAKSITKTVEFDLRAIEFTKITVYTNVLSTKSIAGASVSPDGKRVTTTKGVAQSIAVDRSKTYKVVAEAKIDNKVVTKLPDGRPLEAALSWVSSNEKMATVKGYDNGRGTVTGVKKGTSTISINGSTKKNSKPAAIKATFKTTVTTPTKSIVLSTKNSGIAATNKNQTITVKAVLDKGTTSKAKNIVWTATQNGESISTSPSRDNNSIKGGKLVLKSGKYKAGDKFVVTARLAEAGVQSSITLTVVKPSYRAVFVDSSNVKITKLPDMTPSSDPVEIQAKVQRDKNDTTYAMPGEDNVANVTYTVNKKGIVQLVDNKVTPIKKGTVKITATTTDGKKATLTIKVN